MLPTVTHDTAINSACDLMREEMEAGADRSVLMEKVMVVSRENPEILRYLGWLTQDYAEPEKMAALLGMAVAYSALKAQAEVEALERLAKVV